MHNQQATKLKNNPWSKDEPRAIHSTCCYECDPEQSHPCGAVMGAENIRYNQQRKSITSDPSALPSVVVWHTITVAVPNCSYTKWQIYVTMYTLLVYQKYIVYNMRSSVHAICGKCAILRCGDASFLNICVCMCVLDIYDGFGGEAPQTRRRKRVMVRRRCGHWWQGSTVRFHGSVKYVFM